MPHQADSLLYLAWANLADLSVIVGFVLVIIVAGWIIEGWTK